MQTTKSLSKKIISSNLLVYGLTHALVDLVGAGILFSITKMESYQAEHFVSLAFLYTLLAFGLQAPLGLLTDYLKAPRLIAVLGCLATGLAILVLSSYPIFAVFLAGLGNALFHIGGGTISLFLTPTKATAPGLYVALGAVGLLIGTILGKSGEFATWPFLVLLILMGTAILAVPKPSMNYSVDRSKPIHFFKIILLLVLVSITIRSFVGFIVDFPWKSDFFLLISLTLAVVLGKAGGGILADRFGWTRIAVGALAVSVPLLTFGSHIPQLGIVGMFLFNMTMPVTLVAVSNVLPGRPAFAFGLTCLALLIGSLPIFAGLRQSFSTPTVILTVLYISATSLFVGLQLLQHNKVFRYTKSASVKI